jgi:NodT family efflux transporter outer membrane factor (OMF) lipoprotein
VQAVWGSVAAADANTVDKLSIDSKAFWATFHDSTLEQLLAQAEANSPTLQSAAQYIVQAEQILRADAGGSLPSATFNASSAFGQPTIASKLKNLNTGATTNQVLGQGVWEVDFWGNWARATEADRANLAGIEDQFAAAKLSLQASVASTYISVRQMERRLTVAQDNLKVQAENKRLAEARYRLGATTELDLRQSQAQYEQTNAQLPVLAATLEQYQHAVSVLVGQTPDYFARNFAATQTLPALPQGLSVGAPRDLLRRRPDVHQAEMTAAAQSARIGQAQSALYPSFSLNGSFGYSTTSGLDTLFQWDNRALSYGVGFYLPLFDRGRLHAQIAIQDSVFRQALLAYQGQVLKAQQEVEDGLSALRGATIQLLALQRALEAAARSAQIAQTQYRAGQTDYTTVSAADQAQLQTSDSLVQAQGSELQAYINTFRALGGGWTGATQTSNKDEGALHE